LDFPAVDWVIQVDCPEDVDTYIHRVGRTARYDAAGSALLFLLPSEQEGMLESLEKKKIPVDQIRVNPKKIKSIRQSMVMFCSKDPEIKYLGQKVRIQQNFDYLPCKPTNNRMPYTLLQCFISYMRSVYLQSNKNVFKVDELPAEAFAESLGLPGAPKIKFIKKGVSAAAKNAIRVNKKDVESDNEEDEEKEEEEAGKKVDEDSEVEESDNDEEEDEDEKPNAKVCFCCPRKS
jgi:ATP-dependent RNA helicase DDX10/DBP4